MTFTDIIMFKCIFPFLNVSVIIDHVYTQADTGEDAGPCMDFLLISSGHAWVSSLSSASKLPQTARSKLAKWQLRLSGN